MQAELQRAGVHFTLHEVITLSRTWSADGAVIPVASVLAALYPERSGQSGQRVQNNSTSAGDSDGVAAIDQDMQLLRCNDADAAAPPVSSARRALSRCGRESSRAWRSADRTAALECSTSEVHDGGGSDAGRLAARSPLQPRNAADASPLSPKRALFAQAPFVAPASAQKPTELLTSPQSLQASAPRQSRPGSAAQETSLPQAYAYEPYGRASLTRTPSHLRYVSLLQRAS